MFACIHVRDPRAALSAHASLLDCASAFSPRVEDTATGTVVLDIEGLEHLFGSTAELAQHLQGYIAGLGITVHIGIASNPDAAMCAARGWPGITILERGSEAARLKTLDVALLPLEPETLETLLRWGIRTFGALAKLPAKELSSRLGRQSIHLHRLARGCAVRPLVPRKESLQFVETLELDDALVTLEPMTFILNRLCEVLFLRLRSRGLAALELNLTLKRERPHAPFVLPLRLPVPARNPRVITRLFMLALEAHPPGAAVTEVRLEATPSKPRIIQNGLFVPLSPEPEKLELTLARIAAVVGKDNVGSPEPLDTFARHRFTMHHFGSLIRPLGTFSRREKALHQDSTIWMEGPLPPGEGGHRPGEGSLRLFRPALEATVRMVKGAPAWIAFSGMHGEVAAASGPWRSSGDWWNTGTAWTREEWDIAVSDSLLRIYRANEKSRWYAEGIYD
jgi:protein ImuB